MDTNEVRRIMKEQKIKPVDLATEMDMDVSTFYRKMKNDAFSAKDLIIFKRMLHMSDKAALDFLL